MIFRLLPSQWPADSEPFERHVALAARLSRWGLWLLLIGVLPLVLWLALAPLSDAVVAAGVVKVDLNRRVIQHAEGGTVRAVHVREGQHVKRGDVLLELGDVTVQADRQRLESRLMAERVGLARLEAEQAGLDEPRWPPDALAAARTDQNVAQQLAKEKGLFAARRDALNGQRQLLQSQRAIMEREVASLVEQIRRAGEASAAQSRELELNRELGREGYISPSRINQLESALADYGVKLEDRRTEVTRTQQRIVEIDLKLRGLQSEYAQQASDQLKTAGIRVTDIEQELRKATDAQGRQRIVAPEDGEVLNLRYTVPGGVVTAREAIAELVPTAPNLLVEVRVRPEDVERIHLGQHTQLHFAAFKYRTTQMIDGEVSYLSPDRLVERESGLAFYLAHVKVDPKNTGLTQSLKLLAGMPVEAYITGRTRTPLRYLLEPITQVLRRGGRER